MKKRGKGKNGKKSKGIKKGEERRGKRKSEKGDEERDKSTGKRYVSQVTRFGDVFKKSLAKKW